MSASKMFAEYRIELEERIMDCWRVVDDIKTVYTVHQDIGELSVDEMSIILMGIEKLYCLKFRLLFSTFEKHIQGGYKNQAEQEEELDVLNTKLVLLEDELNRLRGEVK
jgi:hypothetical protein